MRITLLSMLCWLLALPLWADQSNLILVVDGVTYSNVTFKTATPTTVSIIHQTGAATLPLEKLPPEIQKQFDYSPKKAAQYQLKLVPDSVGLTLGTETSAPPSRVSGDASSRPGISNAQGNPLFAAYDEKLIKAVQKRWYALIERYRVYDTGGLITVHFQLFADGHLENLQSESTGGRILALFCEKAVIESAPFDPLPADLRARVGKAPRNISFTFYY